MTSPKISWSVDPQSIDIKQLQGLIDAVQKSTPPQRVHIDIYVGPKEASTASGGFEPPKGPHEVNRGAWLALQPPKTGTDAKPVNKPE